MPCATRCTSPFSYSQTCSTFRTTGHIATARASLGSVFLIHDFKTATCVLAFIGQLSFKLKPTCIIYRFGEFAFLLLNWVVLTSPTTIRALSLTNWVVNLWIGVLPCMFDFGMDRFDTLFVFGTLGGG